MYGYARLDRNRNEVIREKVGGALIEDKIRETRPRWFGHVKRRSGKVPMRMGEKINISWCRRGRGHPNKS